MRKLFIIIAIAIFHQAYSQNRLELDSLFAGAYKTQTLDSLKWQTGTSNFTYLQNEILVHQTVKSEKVKEILSLEELNKITGESFSRFPQHSWLSENKLEVRTRTFYGIVDIKSGKTSYKALIDSGAENIFISKAKNIAYTLDSALIVIDSTGAKSTAIEKQTSISYGYAPFRNEFGKAKGMIWSPDGKKLLFFKVDESTIATEALIDSTGNTIDYIHYPRAGADIGKTTIGIYDTELQSITYINTEKENGKYLTTPAWNPDSRSIFINLLNRKQTNVQMKEYDIESGDYIRMVMKESGEKYFEPLITPIFLQTKPEFLWLSNQEGHAHLFHYDVEGLLLSPLTTGDWDITKIIGLDAKEENIYFIGTRENDPTGRYVYKANIISLAVTCLSKVAGTHNAVIDITEGHILDIYSNYETPQIINLKDTKGKIIREVHKAKTPFAYIDVPTLEHGTIRSNDGKTDLHYHVYKPDNFDVNELYPVIIYMYGGPHVQLVRNKWLGGIGMLPHLLAQEEFIVYMMDNRGSYGRGLEFEQATHLKLGQVELEDQLALIKHISDFSYIDETRIGTIGWSFGGFMSLNLATKAPGKTKIAFAGAPVTSWTNYEAMYTERYLGTPESNPEGYSWANLTEQIDTLQTKVHIVSGNLDYVTVPSQHREYTKLARQKGKNVSLQTYYGHKHHILGDERKLMIERTIDFFVDNL